MKKPPLLLHLAEGIRSAFEYLRCLVFLLFHRYTNEGNGRPVMVVPGFLTNDFFTRLLRQFLRKSGYAVYGWNQGINLGNLENLKTLTERMHAIQLQHQQKVALVGWSLGGIYVREIAKQHPEMVQQVITMGSPFAAPEAPNYAVWVFNLFSNFDAIDKAWRDQLPVPAPVRTTALYSIRDGIVPWQACLEKEDDLHHNIKVEGSHWGLPVNISVMKIVADCLIRYA